MTTGENIDSTDMAKELENVIVTSDETFERVSSNEKMIDEGDSGYLKQNTAGLVQEIPNISFLDIADTMLESKKTFHGRENWILKIGDAGKSVEAQPQDIGIYRDVVTELQSGLGYPKFSTYTTGSNTKCFDSNSTLPGIGAFEINEDGIYRVSYSYNIADISSLATGIGWYIVRLTSGGQLTTINYQFYGNGVGGGAIGITSYSASGDTHLQLNKGDRIMFAVNVTDTNGGSVGRGFKQAEFTLQFIQYTL